LTISPKTEVDFILEENCIAWAVFSVEGFILPLNFILMHIRMKLLGKFYYHIEQWSPELVGTERLSSPQAASIISDRYLSDQLINKKAEKPLQSQCFQYA